MVTKVVATAFGGPEVLAVVDEEVGEPGPGQALLEVRAAGTNPIDYKLYGGARGKDPSLLPMSLGLEASGWCSPSAATVLTAAATVPKGLRVRSMSATR